VAAVTNPLIDDRNVEFLLYEVLHVEELCGLPTYQDHSRETFDMYMRNARRLAREVMFPAYRPMDIEPPVLEEGRVKVHAAMKELYPRMLELGLVNATRPYEVGGAHLPFVVFGVANAYLMAANLSAYAYVGLTTGAARLIESFGSDELRKTYMEPMYRGEWAGTMALTEPNAGSSLTDVTTKAKPTDAGHHLIEGAKVFISGGDQDLTDNIVHLTLARIEGAPPGIKGVSLFAIPARRIVDGELVDNDCAVSGLFHKIGWRGVPSIALSFGERGDCHGYLVGTPHQGIKHMFQMMNEARLMVGLNGISTASVAYHEALEYAKTRPQGRKLGERDPTQPQVAIIEHADVRRMLLRQKSIVEGGFALLARASMYQDLSEHAQDEAERERCTALLNLLTPVAKSFPAEHGFEANTLAVQVHGGYGYTSEYLPEAWWRDQKLNSIHEGTTGIHSLDLLGRKVMMNGGRAMQLLDEEIRASVKRAREGDVDDAWCSALVEALETTTRVTMHLGALGMGGDVEGMLLHSVDYLEMFGLVVIGWQWIEQATAATTGLASESASGDFYRGKLCAAQYWLMGELGKVDHLAGLIEAGEDSYARVQPAWL
jgi:alkylation response protein AidB-like acyl-CoA dehydrogenase